MQQAVADYKKLLILPHNDPDPDAITAAFGLSYILSKTMGVESKIAYQGIIGRAENRALVRYLGYPLSLLKDSALPVILVDAQPGIGNNPWQPDMQTVAVIDHHPRKDIAAEVPCVDVRPQMGATATIIYEYFLCLGLEIPDVLATALFYGIKTDTKGLSRGASSADAAAYYHLQAQINAKALAEIERAQVPATYFKSFADALGETKVFNNLVVAFAGHMHYPDMAAEMADQLIRLEKIEWVICSGIYNNKLLLAVRTANDQNDAGELVKAIVQQQGTAGGHGTMAGGQIWLKDNQPADVLQTLNKHIRQQFNIQPDVIGQSLL